MSGHTPGPWRAQAVNPREYIVWKQGYEGGGAVCRVDRGSRFLAGPLKKSAGADARLIAAAPELLEAAYRMVTLGFDRDVWTDEECAVIDALQAAIAKAEGTA